MIRKLVIEKKYGMLGEFDVYLDTLGYKPSMSSNLKSNEGGVFSMEHMAALLPGTQERLIDHNKQSVDGMVGVICGSKETGRSGFVVLLDGEKHPVPMLRGR